MFVYNNDLDRFNFDYHLNECIEMLQYLNTEKENINSIVIESSDNNIVKSIKQFFSNIINELIDTWKTIIKSIDKFFAYAKKNYYDLFIHDNRKQNIKILASFSFGFVSEYDMPVAICISIIRQ